MEAGQGTGPGRGLSWGVLLGLVLAAGAVVPRGRARREVYAGVRWLVTAYTVYGYPGYRRMSGPGAVVRYPPGFAADAALVLAATEEYRGPVMADFGVRVAARVPVVVYPTATAMNRSFGWAGDADNMGAYWAGTIRVVAPSAWVRPADPAGRRDVFFSEGPMAHELTHLAVDLATDGAAPRWLQEGLAQWEELRLSGFRLPPPDGDAWYSLADLAGHFDSLADQWAAYYQSLEAVTYMYRHWGRRRVAELLARLREGEAVDRSLRGAFGLAAGEFAAAYREFAAANPDWPAVEGLSSSGENMLTGRP